ncbi:D-alanine--D-alanine ligase A [Helicobacter sp. 12S02634-8]|uniref:D-alanine--D-alanine ligase n=1 Tax=Helicobacter sp. 12S02634-8 TaxID=1476199 RepID=UPI000BA6BF32|nr:D-alanine--D-alanine ligase [Helicobacter sp. 12S02634-8]PAF46647.1 D-alanine--D-alanine ligase A [Helicobacter sp. 12S02634-8]
MKFSILFGGISWEHEISIVSAISLKKVLGDSIGHFIFTDASHRFYLIPAENMKSNFFSSQDYKKCTQLDIKLGGFYSHGFFGSKLLNTEMLINLIHGADGEDGTIASLLEFHQIPFIGPRIEACVLSFNKYLTKLYAKERDVKTLPFQVLRKHSPRNIGSDFPLIIKPNRLGSSIGVSVIYAADEADYAIDSAFEFDNEALIEPFIKGVKEYNIAGCKVAEGNNANSEYIFSIIEEPSKKDLLDFENKYLDFSRTEQVLKANIPADMQEKIKDAFKKLYCDKFEGALIRCDFFVIDNEVYLNEINPIPGSMSNYLFDDFKQALQGLSLHLPKKEPIKVSYKYIEKIQRAKGK